MQGVRGARSRGGSPTDALVRRGTGSALTCLLIGLSVARAADAPPGIASCSGCHPAKFGVDTPVPRLLGQDPAALLAAMQAFRGGQRPATVMDRIAKGFSEEEIKAIAAWYGAQPARPK